jgi:hypothetical protein
MYVNNNIDPQKHWAIITSHFFGLKKNFLTLTLKNSSATKTSPFLFFGLKKLFEEICRQTFSIIFSSRISAPAARAHALAGQHVRAHLRPEHGQAEVGLPTGRRIAAQTGNFLCPKQGLPDGLVSYQK